ncbi:MAG: DUF3987 domain-containing protein [Candidatus Kapabacteria bacterium]|nr:DUF3987 domain-containing protein [Candidatus Kapabacteria bacterium]
MEQDKKNGLAEDQNHLLKNSQNKNNQSFGISKEEVLQRTNGGENIYKYIFSSKGIEYLIGRNMRNPLYSDKNPSLSINLINGNYLFNDFGNPEFQGDVFDFAGHYWSINPRNNFQELLSKINIELHLEITDRNRDDNEERLIKYKPFTNDELSFWNAFGVSETILDKFQVKSVDWFNISNEFGNKKIINQDVLIFAYQISSTSYKIYQPNHSQYKFSWVGKKPENYVFGFNQLDYSMDTVIIAAGEKDVLSFVSLGYNAVCFNSETEIPDNQIIQILLNNFDNVLVCYDKDNTGKKQAKILADKYSLSIVDIEYIFGNNLTGKDISDFIYNAIIGHEGYNIEKIHETVNHSKLVYQSKLKHLPKPFPLSTYNMLPKILYESLIYYDNYAEKEMMLLTSLSVLSGLLPNYYSIYHGKRIESNLFLFVVGKAASGKGILNDAYIIGDVIHKQLASKSNTKTTLAEREIIFIPGNSSHSSFLTHLLANNERGILFETEADVLNGSISQDWGDYSTSMRQSFHHEKISQSRKKDNEFFELIAPKLSVIISGTQEQFGNFFNNPENGLYSRFCIYNLFSKSEWKNVFSFTESVKPFKSISEWVERNYYFLKSNEIEFSFTEEQQNEFNEILRSKYDFYSKADESGNLTASIKRLGIILTRLAMVLTILENENVENLKQLQCPQTIFDSIILIIDSLIANFQYSYLKLPNGVKRGLGIELTQPEKLYNSLNDSFSRADAIEIGLKLGIKRDYIDKILKMNNFFTKTGRGRYMKSKSSAVSATLLNN